MNDYNWENAFGDTPQEFHKRVEHTLNNLKKENVKMKKAKVIMIAAAAVMVIGTSAIIASSGTMRLVTGHSTSYSNYKELPTAEQAEEKIGVTPKLLNEFSNGYAYKGAVDVNHKIEDVSDDGSRVVVQLGDGTDAKYNSLSIRYKNGDDEVTLDVESAVYNDAAKTDNDGEDTSIKAVEDYNGVSIIYGGYTGKFVPPNYQKTAQDIADESEGKIVFSYGTDDIEIIDIQGVSWTQDGVFYHINAMNSPLGQEELVAMAKELIDF